MKICGKTECPLYANGTPMLSPMVMGQNPKVMIVVDCPDAKETKRIFSSEQYRFLQDKIGDSEILTGENSLVLATAVRCHCDQNEYTESHRKKAIKCCREYFLKTIEKYKPKLILSFGGMALNQTTKQSGVKKYQGTLYKSEELDCYVMPMYAPGYILRNQSHEETWNTAFNQVKNFIKRGWSEDCTALKSVSTRDFREVQSIKGLFTKAEALDGIAIDTETQGLDWTHPLFTCISYSIAVTQNKSYQIFLFEECLENEKDYSILWERKVGAKKVKQLVHVKRSENFENKVRELRWFLENDDIKKIMHNGNYDCHVFQAFFKVAGRLLKLPQDKRTVQIKGYNFDTQNAAQLYNENVYAMARLEQLQFAFTDIPDRYDTGEFKLQFAKDDMISVPKEALKTYACLHKKSKIILANGSTATIGAIVKGRQNVEVLSYNTHNKKIEVKKVYGWVRQEYPSMLWYSIILNYSKDKAGIKVRGSFGGPEFTPDHKILTNAGYIPIENIDVGKHRVATGVFALPRDSRSILLGCLLGDGYLHTRNGRGYGFSFKQKDNRSSFFSLVVRAFKDYAPGRVAKRKNLNIFETRYSTEMTDIALNTEFLRRHTERSKLRVTSSIIPQLTPLALAVWYFSDGTLTKTGEVKIAQAFLDYDPTHAHNILQWLLTLGITANIHGKGKTTTVYITKSSHKTFFGYIAPFALDDILYKIPKEFHETPKYVYNFDSKDIYYAQIKDIKTTQRTMMWGNGHNFSYCIDVEDNHNFLTEVGFVHNCFDTAVTKAASVTLKKYLSENKKLERYMTNMVMPTLETLREMETCGVYVDTEALTNASLKIKAMSAEAHDKALSLTPVRIKEAHEQAGLKLSRTALVRDILYSEDGFKLPVKNTTKSKMPATDQDTIKLLQESVRSKKIMEFFKNFVDYKKYDKLVSTYLEGFKGAVASDGNIHTKFSSCFATTGRVASSRPNLMNIPNKGDAAAVVRRIIAARKGWKVLKADASQAELRWMAHYARERQMLKIFREGKVDIHSATAQFVSGHTDKTWAALSAAEKKILRKQAKCVNFGLIYGMSVQGYVNYAKIVYDLADMTEETGQQHSDSFFSKYSGLRPYYEEVTAFGRKYGYVESALGRRRYLPELKSNNRGLLNQAIRQAVNFPTQSASSDSVLLGGNEILKMKLPKRDFRLCLFIHDELIAFVREDCDIEKYGRIMKESIENPPLKKLFGVNLTVPLESEVEWGDNLNDCKELKL